MNKYSTLKNITVTFLLVVVTFSFSQAQKWRVGNKNEGLTGLVNVSALFPTGKDYRSAFTAHGIIGYKPVYTILIGVGSGMDAWQTDIFVPAFVHLRYLFMDQDLAPYLAVEGGYSFPVNIESVELIVSSGPMVNVEFGLKYFIEKGVALTGSAIYRFQSMPYELAEGVDPNSASVAYRTGWQHGPGLRLGIQF